MAATTGDQRIDDYDVLDVLGEGGMGTVSRGRHRSTGRLVAIKQLHGRLSDDAEQQNRFRREAALCRELQHPGLVRLLDFQLSGESPYLVFDLVEGETLASIIAREGSLIPARALDLVAQLAEALGVLHEAGIVHRDLKPANVIVRPGDQTCLLDLGVAKHFGDAVSTMDELTREGLVLGTLPYLPPDAFVGQPDPRQDVWSLGVLLFELLTGERPFGGKEFDGVIAFLDRLRAGNFPAPSARARDVPAAIDDACARLMALDPHARPPDARPAATLLRRVQGTLLTPSSPQATPRLHQGRPSARRSPASGTACSVPHTNPYRVTPGILVASGLTLALVGALCLRPAAQPGTGAESSHPPVSPSFASPVSPLPLFALRAAVEKARPNLGPDWLRRFASSHRDILKSVPQTASIALRGHLEQIGILSPLLECSKGGGLSRDGLDPAQEDGLRSALADLELIECFCDEHRVPRPWGDFSISSLAPGTPFTAAVPALDLKAARSWIRAASSKANRFFPGGSWTDMWTVPAPGPDERSVLWLALMRWRTGLVLDVRVNRTYRRLLRWQAPLSDPGPIVTPAVEYTNEVGEVRRGLPFSVLSEPDRAGQRSYLGLWIPREHATQRIEIEIRMVDLPLSRTGLRDPELTTRILSLVKVPAR